MGCGDGFDLGHARGGGKVHHFQFVAGAEVVEDGVEEEAVKLRLRQRVCSFELDWVLGGQHEKGRGQRIYMASHSAGAFLHGFEQGGPAFLAECGLSRPASRTLPKIGPWTKVHLR